MATYVLPDNRFTDEQRKRFAYEMVPDDGIEITFFLMEHFPAVFDDAVQNIARANVLAGLRMTPEQRLAAAQANLRHARKEIERLEAALRYKTPATNGQTR